MSLDTEIADVFHQLNVQLQDNDPRSRRDAAQACYMWLETLHASALHLRCPASGFAGQAGVGQLRIVA